MIPPVPYRGAEPYIFISYAHRDADRVWPIVAKLQLDGYRVWYDEGIDPGTEWDENIASHVTGCGYFLAFLSENYLRSDNCKDELNFARDLGKKQVLIYLEDVELPAGISLRFGRLQNFRADRPGFMGRLYEAEGIQAFTTGKKIRSKRWILPTVLGAAALIAAALILPGMLSKENPQPEPETQPAITEPAATEPAEDPFTLRQTAFINDSGVKLTAQDLRFDEKGGLILECLAENTLAEDEEVLISDFYVNGICCFPDQNVKIAANSASAIGIHWDFHALEEAGLEKAQLADLRLMEGSARLVGISSDPIHFVYYPYGMDNAVYETYAPDADDIVFVDNDDCRAILTDYYNSESGSWIGEFALVNLTDRLTTVTLSLEKTNGYLSGFWWDSDVRPGCVLRKRITLDEWQYTQCDSILQLDGSVHLSDPITHDSFDRYEFTLRPEGGEPQEFPARQLTGEDILLAENREFRVAVIDSYVFHERAYAYCIYCQNLSNRSLDFRLENKIENGVDDGSWSVCYLEPGEQGYRELLYHHDGQTTSMTLTGAIAVEKETGEVIREDIHVDFDW